MIKYRHIIPMATHIHPNKFTVVDQMHILARIGFIDHSNPMPMMASRWLSGKEMNDPEGVERAVNEIKNAGYETPVEAFTDLADRYHMDGASSILIDIHGLHIA